MFVNKRQKVPQPKSTGSIARGVPKNFRKTAPVENAATKSKNANATKEAKKALDWDDISLSSEESKSFERFLKKADDNDEKEKVLTKKDPPTTASSFERPKTSRGGSDYDIKSTPRPQFSSSSALNRLANIEARIKSRQSVTTQNKVSLSGSDFDIDVSSDLEVKRDIGKSDLKLREIIKKPEKKKPATQNSKSIFLTLDDASETSEEDSTARKRFLKTDQRPDDDDTDSQSIDDYKSGKKSFAKKKTIEEEVLKVHVSTDLDESVSLQTYMKSVDKDRDSKKSSSSKKVTFASNLVQSSDFEQSLDDFMPQSDGYNSDDPSSLDEVIPSKLHNIMSLDDLIPSQDIKTDEEEPGRPTSALGFVGLHSVDELMPAGSDVRSSSEYVPSVEENIQTGSSNSEQSSYRDRGNVLQNLHSVDDLKDSDSEVQLELGTKPRTLQKSLFKAQKTVEESETEEIKSESEIYTEDFNSDNDDDTLKDTESISQDVTEASATASSVSEEDSHRSKDGSISYASSSSQSRTSSTVTSRTPSPVRRKQKKKVTTAQVQTEIASGQWLPGSVYADAQSFKPSRLIDNEALDVLTSYNPANLAIQDLLKQQVTLTREFVARSRQLHDLAVNAIPCDYVYGEINEDGLARLKSIWQSDDSVAVPTT